ncbi:hypothetical protein F5Y15DRAFT_401044 [Xylariaceae sp. FL0016]|nr:hypothetical protein F5Y15DRAFT_401044 [Xylariaceae sp. FL0016]
MPEKLREKAAKKLQGPGANPSQLGDPVSMKAEQSDNVPTEDAQGASSPSSSSSTSSGSGQRETRGDESLREKAAKKLHGPGANPSMLGDPISLKAETSENGGKGGEAGAKGKRDSKL